MHSPDLFWGSRRVSAAPSGPEPREAVPRGSLRLPKVQYCDHLAVPNAKPLLPHPCIPSHLFWGGTIEGADPLVCRFSPPCPRSSHYSFATGRASNHVMWARRPRNTYRLCSSSSSVLEGRWMRAADASLRSKACSPLLPPPIPRRRFPHTPLGHHLPPVETRRIHRSDST